MSSFIFVAFVSLASLFALAAIQISAANRPSSSFVRVRARRAEAEENFRDPNS